MRENLPAFAIEERVRQIVREEVAKLGQGGPDSREGDIEVFIDLYRQAKMRGLIK